MTAGPGPPQLSGPMLPLRLCQTAANKFIIFCPDVLYISLGRDSMCESKKKKKGKEKKKEITRKIESRMLTGVGGLR